jgi:hypothetical protein
MQACFKIEKEMFPHGSQSLRALFAELIDRHLTGAARIGDKHVAQYVADVLIRFTHVDNLYRIRNAKSQRLDSVAEMLIASNPLLEGRRSFLYEREVRKHVGDYTLFLAGLFPEYVARLPRQRLALDSMLDYLKAGKESYRIVASFDEFEFREQAPLFRRLADQFELCVFGLNLVKQELSERQRGYYEGLRNILN